MPGAPDQLRTARIGEGGAVGLMLDAACAAAVEEEGQGDEVGGVEAGDADREDVFEGDGGAEADEGEEAGDGCG